MNEIPLYHKKNLKLTGCWSYLALSNLEKRDKKFHTVDNSTFSLIPSAEFVRHNIVGLYFFCLPPNFFLELKMNYDEIMIFRWVSDQKQAAFQSNKV
jgi:hypothetical protein